MDAHAQRGRCVYKIDIGFQGLRFESAAEFSWGQRRARVRLKPIDDGIRATVTVEESTLEEGERTAMQIAGEIYRVALLRHGGSIQRATPPRCMSASLSATSDGKVIFADSVKAEDNLTFSIATIVGAAQVRDLAATVELRLATPPVVTSAGLYAALDAYRIALQTEDAVVRFVILYTALVLSSAFVTHDGRQASVDALIRKNDPNVQIVTFTPPQGQARTETIYLALRNQLLHPEDRAVDPETVMEEIRKTVPQFQALVASVLSKM